MRELSRSELLCPFGFDFVDDLADCFARGAPSGGGADAFGALVAGVGFAGQVSELLELAEEVVQRLFAHPDLGRELGRALVLGAWVLEHVEVRGDQIGEAALVQARLDRLRLEPHSHRAAAVRVRSQI